MTRPRLRRWAAVAAGLALAPASAAAPAGTTLDCMAEGYDVHLSNEGSETVDPGQVVAWEVRFARTAGDFEVQRALAPGASVFVSGALGSVYLTGPEPCTARVR